MNTYKPTITLSMTLLALVPLMSGCIGAPKVRTGAVYTGDPKPGHPCMEFTFIDQTGKADTFSRVRGIVTLVVFPGGPKWPDCERCKEIVALASKVQRPDTPVVVMSIRCPDKPKRCSAAALHQCNVVGVVQLIALCDHQGRVRDLYGPNAVGRFFVVGSEGRIAGSGSVTDMQALETCAKKAVREHERKVEFLRITEEST